MLYVASSPVVGLLAVGLWFRHRRLQLHLRLMISAFVVDLVPVPYIEISRHFQGSPSIFSEALAALKIAQPLIPDVMTAVVSIAPDIATKPITDPPVTTKEN